MNRLEGSARRAIVTVVITFLFLVPTSLPLAADDRTTHSRVGDFTIDAIPGQLLETGQGGNLWWLVEITSTGGFNSEVSLTVSGMPSNSNYWFYPDKVTPPANGKVSAFFRFNTTASTPAGPVDVYITGKNSTLQHSVLRHARVRSGAYLTTEASPFEQSGAPGETVVYNLKLIACKGFQAGVTIFNPSDGALGATYVFVPASPVTVPKDSIVLVQVSVTIPGNAAPNIYNILLSGVTNPYFINWTAGIRLRVVPKDSVSVGGRPWMQNVARGEAATFTFEVRSHGTFSAKTDITVDNPMPADIKTSFSQPSVTPVAGGSNLTTLTVTTSANTHAGIYMIVGKVSSGAFTDRDVVYLWVTDTPDFSVRGTPSSQYVVPAGKVSYTVTVTSLNNFTGDVNLNIESPPDKATVTLSSSKVTLKVEDTINVGLDITAGGSTATGRYGIRVVASNATLMHYVDLELNVVTALPSDFNLTSHDASRTAVDQPCIYHVSMSSLSGYNGNVAMSVEGLPTGASAKFELDTVHINSGATAWSNLTVTPTGATPYGEFLLRIVGTNATAKLRHEAEVLFKILPHAGVVVTASPNPVDVLVGAWALVSVQVSGTHGYTGTVDFSQVTLPAGFTAIFSKTTVTPDDTIVMNLTVASTAAVGHHDVSFFAKNATAQFPCALDVNVQNFTLSSAGASVLVGLNGKATVKGTADAGFTGLVGISLDGVPTGVTMTPPANFVLPGSVDIPIAVSASAKNGSYQVTVKGNYGGNIRTCSLTLNLTNFTIEATPKELSLLPGQKADVRIDVNSVLGFTGTVQLTIMSPQNIAVSLSVISVVPYGTSTLTITLPRTTALGTYVIHVNGTYSNQVRGTDVKLNVYGHKVQVDPPFLKVARGAQGSYRVNVTGELGFSGLVNLSVEGLPKGVSAGFGSKSITTGNFTQLTVQVGSGALPDVYTITVNGTCGIYTVKVSVQLRVMDFWLESDPTVVSVIIGQNATYKVSMGGKIEAGDEVLVTVVAPLNADVSAPTFVLKQGTTKTLVIGTTDMPVGDFNITLRPDAGSELVIVLSVQDFSINGTPVTIAQGAKGTSTVKVMSIHGYSGSVDLSLDQGPQGMRTTLKPTRVTAGSSAILTIDADASCPTGTYSLFVRSTSPVARVGEITVLVTAGSPNYDMKVTPAQLQVRRGDSGSYAIALTLLKGSKATVSLEVQGLPAGVTADWTTANAVDVPQTKNIQLTVDKTAGLGKYNITFLASDGTFVVKRYATLEVTKQKEPGILGSDNSFLLGILLLFVILIIAAIIVVAYIMTRKKKTTELDMEPAEPEPEPVAVPQYTRKPKAPPKRMAPPETQYTVEPEEPTPVQMEEPLPEPVPMEDVPPVVEPEEPPIPEPEPPKEVPKKVEPAPKPKKPEIKKDTEVNIDDILKKLKSS